MSAARRRLDAELVHRKLARSRTHAHDLITAGKVTVGGFPATKPATQVAPDVSIRISDTADDWASRGAHKLLGALDAFDLDLTGKRILDAGASTGGFTDVCLRRGAREVVAVDVGYGQLAWRLAKDPRVTVMDRTNIRFLQLEEPCEMMVGDLSFISLTLVLETIAANLTADADLLPMVKPQFEVGKDRLGHGGVVRSPQLRAEVTATIAEFAQSIGLGLREVAASPLPGPSGNVEYFLWLTKGATPLSHTDVISRVHRAVEEGPQ
ncbi:MAG: TlyA family RNA methyltransferase [Corynebacterium sp.]|nr:TlyA family RNA methyltransferase [Corynebacterium sp.]